MSLIPEEGAANDGSWTGFATRFRNIRVTDPAGKVLFYGMPALPALKK